MMAVQRPDEVAFVVSMAGPAVSGYVLIPSQIEISLAMVGISREEIDAKLEAQHVIMDAVIEGNTGVVDSVLRAQIEVELQRLSEEDLAMVGDVDIYIEQVVTASLASMEGPWFRNFLIHDPADAIREVNCPTLVLLGELDTQVIPVVNLGPMQEALAGNSDHGIVVFEDANHLLTGEVMEYAVLEPAFLPAFVDTLSRWLQSR